MSISIGNSTIDRASTKSSGTTYVDKTTPADGNGALSNISIYATTQLSGCKVGIFYEKANVDSLTCRSSVSLGTVAAGLTNNNVNLKVKVGDYIGIYFTGGTLDSAATGGYGVWYLAGDQMSCDDAIFSRSINHIISISGSGEMEYEKVKVSTKIVFGITN
jgi:hypothetical protein